MAPLHDTALSSITKACEIYQRRELPASIFKMTAIMDSFLLAGVARKPVRVVTYW